MKILKVELTYNELCLVVNAFEQNKKCIERNTLTSPRSIESRDILIDSLSKEVTKFYAASNRKNVKGERK